MNIDNIQYDEIPSSYREIKTYGGYWVKVENLVRRNLITVFNSSYYDDDLKKWIVRNYINRNNSIEDIRNFVTKFKTRNKQAFLLFCLKNFPTISIQFEKLYSKYNTWQIAELINCSQTTVRRVIGDYYLDITDRSMRCSKAHLLKVPIIREILGDTITEYFYKGYWFDEFSEKYNLDIEIDGAWCHDPDYDNQRDEFVKSNGIKVLRIDSLVSDEELRDILLDFKNNLQ